MLWIVRKKRYTETNRTLNGGVHEKSKNASDAPERSSTGPTARATQSTEGILFSSSGYDENRTDSRRTSCMGAGPRTRLGFEGICEAPRKPGAFYLSCKIPAKTYPHLEKGRPAGIWRWNGGNCVVLTHANNALSRMIFASSQFIFSASFIYTSRLEKIS